MPLIQLARFESFRWALSSRIEPSAVCGSQIGEPYSKIGFTRVQNNVFVVSFSENSWVDLITNPRFFNASQHIIPIWDLGSVESLNLKPISMKLKMTFYSYSFDLRISSFFSYIHVGRSTGSQRTFLSGPLLHFRIISKITTNFYNFKKLLRFPCRRSYQNRFGRWV